MQNHNDTGNTKIDGALLLLIGLGTFISQITLSEIVTFITGLGATLYVINQAFVLHKNWKSRNSQK